jgi:hypothetical protein
VSRWLGLVALVALAALGLWAALMHTAPADVSPGRVDRPTATRVAATTDAGSLDNLFDATQIQHAIGGR